MVITKKRSKTKERKTSKKSTEIKGDKDEIDISLSHTNVTTAGSHQTKDVIGPAISAPDNKVASFDDDDNKVYEIKPKEAPPNIDKQGSTTGEEGKGITDNIETDIITSKTDNSSISGEGENTNIINDKNTSNNDKTLEYITDNQTDVVYVDSTVDETNNKETRTHKSNLVTSSVESSGKDGIISQTEDQIPSANKEIMNVSLHNGKSNELLEKTSIVSNEEYRESLQENDETNISTLNMEANVQNFQVDEGGNIISIKDNDEVDVINNTNGGLSDYIETKHISKQFEDADTKNI